MVCVPKGNSKKVSLSPITGGLLFRSSPDVTLVRYRRMEKAERREVDMTRKSRKFSVRGPGGEEVESDPSWSKNRARRVRVGPIKDQKVRMDTQ